MYQELSLATSVGQKCRLTQKGNEKQHFYFMMRQTIILAFVHKMHKH